MEPNSQPGADERVWTFDVQFPDGHKEHTRVHVPGAPEVGRRFRVHGKGLPGPNGNGDLVIACTAGEARLQRQGADIRLALPLQFLMTKLPALEQKLPAATPGVIAISREYTFAFTEHRDEPGESIELTPRPGELGVSVTIADERAAQRALAAATRQPAFLRYVTDKRPAAGTTWVDSGPGVPDVAVRLQLIASVVAILALFAVLLTFGLPRPFTLDAFLANIRKRSSYWELWLLGMVVTTIWAGRVSYTLAWRWRSASESDSTDAPLRHHWTEDDDVRVTGEPTAEGFEPPRPRA